MKTNLGIELNKPLVFFDIESTGLNAYVDRICSICLIKVFPDGTNETKYRLINPEMCIPLEASNIHNILDSTVEKEATFKQISKALLAWLDDCDLCGYNILRFDLPLLKEEFFRCGIEWDVTKIKLIDCHSIHCQMHPRTLTAAYEYYTDKNMQDAHDAQADVEATIEVFVSQLKKYTDDELPKNMAGLNEFCDQRDPSYVDGQGKFKWQDGKVVIDFSKHKGTTLRTLSELHPGFLQWMLDSNFSSECKKLVSGALKGVFPVR